MYEQVNKPKENKSKAVASAVAQKKNNVKQGLGFADNRAEAIAFNGIMQRVYDNTTVAAKKATIQARLGMRNDDMRLLDTLDDGLTIDQFLRQLFLAFAIRPNWIYRGGPRGNWAGEGDCSTLCNEFATIAQDFGIETHVENGGHNIWANQAPIVGDARFGNAANGTRWYFGEHFVVTANGSRYDILFSPNPPPPSEEVHLTGDYPFSFFAEGSEWVEDRANPGVPVTNRFRSVSWRESLIRGSKRYAKKLRSKLGKVLQSKFDISKRCDFDRHDSNKLFHGYGFPVQRFKNPQELSDSDDGDTVDLSSTLKGVQVGGGGDKKGFATNEEPKIIRLVYFPYANLQDYSQTVVKKAKSEIASAEFVPSSISFAKPEMDYETVTMVDGGREHSIPTLKSPFVTDVRSKEANPISEPIWSIDEFSDLAQSKNHVKAWVSMIQFLFNDTSEKICHNNFNQVITDAQFIPTQAAPYFIMIDTSSAQQCDEDRWQPKAMEQLAFYQQELQKAQGALQRL